MKKLFLILSLLITFVLPTSAVAQTSASSSGSSSPVGLPLSGLEITPFLLDLDVAKGGSVDSKVDLVNHSSVPLSVSITPRDFLPGNDGQPQFVPDPTINDQTFSLASWIHIKGSSELVLKPEQVVSISFTLNPPKDAEQGTHYGALLFSYLQSNAIGNASEVQQSVGTIILVRYGEARENGIVNLQTDKKFLWNPDKVTFSNKFSDTGNVHVQPKGEVYVKNMWGKIVSSPFVNRDAANVLPKTDRTFINTWYPSTFSFGRYTAESILIFGRGRLEAHDIVVIWVFPWYILAALGIIIMIILWYIFHGRHWHKRRIIKKHLEKNI